MKTLRHVAAAVAVGLSIDTTFASMCKAETFGVLATNPNVSLCIKESGVMLLALSSAPSKEQLDKVCRTTTCLELLKLLVDLKPEECTIPLGGMMRLRADLLDPTIVYCKEIGVEIAEDTAARTASTDRNSSSSQDGSRVDAVESSVPSTLPQSSSARRENHSASALLAGLSTLALSAASLLL